MVDTQKIKRNQSKHATMENHKGKYQEGNKGTTNQPENNKMVIPSNNYFKLRCVEVQWVGGGEEALAAEHLARRSKFSLDLTTRGPLMTLTFVVSWNGESEYHNRMIGY